MNRAPRPAMPPDEEFEFSQIPQPEIGAACWWEYFRESLRVKRAVSEYRAGAALLSKEIEPIRDITGISMLAAIAAVCPSFPDKPWLSLTSREHALAMSAIDEGSAKAAWIRPDIYMASPSDVSHEPSGVYYVRLPIMGGSRKALGATRQSILMTVNWAASDGDIIDTVQEWLNKNRPPAYPNSKRRPRLTGSNLCFPAQYNKALSWLTPLRLHPSLGTWKAVAKELMKPSEVNPDAQKDIASKARRIIAWLDGGPIPKFL